MNLWEGKSGIYLIAEIGGNHEGDFGKAKELTELACKSGVDAVKLQIYTADSLVSKAQDPERHAHFKKFE
ncbi:MAG TPA: N-acetylneuraminate synthase, partial [Cytophagales bacterium]|nr:N-acetylneuraminate synthase [Cytophagales bacterium]